MKLKKFTTAIACVLLAAFASHLPAQDVALGTWLEEGTGSVTGSGDTFTATPMPSGIADNGDNFGERNAARHRVYQTFSPIDFSQDEQEIVIQFDVTFAGTPAQLDTDFRMSLVDTSTNQGFYAVAWDTEARAGSYNRARFVDNLDGATGDPHAGAFNDAINGSGTVAASGAAPTITNGATELGLVDGNTLSFEVVFTRNAGDLFSFTTNVTEANGDVVYEETAGSYDPVNPTSGDTSVSNTAITSFNGIVFGIFDDNPFPGSTGSYTVSNIMIAATNSGGILGDVNRDGDVNFLDIAPFIALLSNGEFQVEADIDLCGKVDFLDIAPFIALLSSQ